jgi:hypothetical protein
MNKYSFKIYHLNYLGPINKSTTKGKRHKILIHKYQDRILYNMVKYYFKYNSVLCPDTINPGTQDNPVLCLDTINPDTYFERLLNKYTHNQQNRLTCQATMV